MWIRFGSRKFRKGRWDAGQLLRCYLLLLLLLLLRTTWEFFKNKTEFYRKRGGCGPLIPQMWMWFSEQFIFICEICLFLLRHKQREEQELESDWLGNSSKGLLACLLVPWQWNLKTIRQWASMWIGSYLQNRKYWLVNSECEARRNLSKNFAAFVLWIQNILWTLFYVNNHTYNIYIQFSCSYKIDFPCNKLLFFVVSTNINEN